MRGNGNKLPITAEDARTLFRHLQTSITDIIETDPSFMQEDEKGRNLILDELDRELRSVFEMSRYGLDIVDFAEQDNGDSRALFRAYCEDSAGMESVDLTKLDDIEQQFAHLLELMEVDGQDNVRLIEEVKDLSGKTTGYDRAYFDQILNTTSAELESNARSTYSNELANMKQLMKK